MRPYPDEILRSMQFSLDTYVIPHVDDKWGSYVAKVMRRMLVHLERRWQLEGPLLLEDSEDLHALFVGLGDDVAALEVGTGGDRAAGLLDALAAALDDPPVDPATYVSIETLTERNERLREALVVVIEGLDDLAQDLGHEALDPMRHEIRTYLRRQVDRDTRLAEPTFMSFAPPPVKRSGESGEAA